MRPTYQDFAKIVNLTPYSRPQLLSAQEKDGACDALLKFLLKERGMIAAFSASYEKKRTFIRRYMNERLPLPIPDEILKIQDALFWTESVERKIEDVASFSYSEHGMAHYRGDICKLNSDAIVNAANSALLGCFRAGHQCIDNIIHSYAGMQLRDDCAKIVAVQGEAQAGDTILTRAYNLPSKYVLHTVGPIVLHGTTEVDRAALRSCYLSCLNLCEQAGLSTVAFCCIATGVFNYPHDEAAEIATGTVFNWKLRHPESKLKVIFNTYLEEDARIYSDILKMME